MWFPVHNAIRKRQIPVGSPNSLTSLLLAGDTRYINELLKSFPKLNQLNLFECIEVGCDTRRVVGSFCDLRHLNSPCLGYALLDEYAQLGSAIGQLTKLTALEVDICGVHVERTAWTSHTVAVAFGSQLTSLQNLQTLRSIVPELHQVFVDAVCGLKVPVGDLVSKSTGK